MRKTIVIGIDGACWEYIKPLLEEDKLPNIKRMMDSGSYGILESVLPPISPVAWSSVITGTNAGKHGIFGWKKPKRNESSEAVDSTMRKVAPFWKYLNEEGLRVGIFNIPLTYPPEDIDGYIVPGFEVPANCKDAVYPQDLSAIVKKKYGDFLNNLPLDLLLSQKAIEMGVESYFQKYCFSEEMRTHLALDLAPECDVILFNYMITDHLNHQVRDFDAITRAYRFVDEMVGTWLKRFPDENYILMSDHGSTRIKGIVNLNQLFFNEGLLQLRKRQIDSLSKDEVNKMLHLILHNRGLRPNILEKVVRRIYLLYLYLISEKHRVNRLRKLRQAAPKEVNCFLYLDKIDYEKTIVHVNTDDGFIFLNKQEMNEKRYNQLVQKLMSIKDPFSGDPLFSFIRKKEAFFKGNQVKLAPELYGHFWESTCFIKTSLNFSAFKLETPYRQTGLYRDFDTCGSHQRDGIYIVFGPDLKKSSGKKGKRYSLLDVTPTVLYLQKVGIPENFDGKIMRDALAPEYVRCNSVEYITSVDYAPRAGKSEIKFDDKQRIIEKLKILGYID